GLMLFAGRQYPAAFGPTLAAESRHVLDWLLKMWDQDSRTLYYQVGLGDGSATVLGDHDLWRLPEADDDLHPRAGAPDYFIKNRPALRAGSPGAAISPNLAGRLAAAFGLCSQVFRASDPTYANQCLIAAQTIYDLAKTASVGELMTTAP